MSLSENFLEAIESMKRPAAAVGLVLATAFSASGCADMRLNLPEGNLGGIPVGRVINQSVNRDIYDAKKGAARAITGPLRGTACHDENGNLAGVVVGDARQCEAYKRNGTGVAPRPTR